MSPESKCHRNQPLEIEFADGEAPALPFSLRELQYSHISNRRADPFPTCCGRWREAPDGVWPAASAYSRIARPSPRTCVGPYLLSAPHPAFGHLPCFAEKEKPALREPRRSRASPRGPGAAGATRRGKGRDRCPESCMGAISLGRHPKFGARTGGRQWADSAPTGVASARTGVPAKAVIRLRVRNRIYRPLWTSVACMERRELTLTGHCKSLAGGAGRGCASGGHIVKGACPGSSRATM